MKYQIIDNYFSAEFFNKLRNKVTANNFQWQFAATINDNQTNIEDSYFTQVIYQDHVPITFLWDEIKYILDNHLNAIGLLRAKANLYLQGKELVEHDQHRDYPIPHKGAIIYLNTCDGFTRLEDGTKVESVQNRILLFDASTLHNSTNTTNAKGRFNININYF